MCRALQPRRSVSNGENSRDCPRGRIFCPLETCRQVQAQKWLALAVVLGLLVLVFIAAGPLSSVEPRRIDAFVPAYTTAMFVNDSITAILLFAQFSILRSRAILVIASGYLFTALILIPWVLAFPGVFVPEGSDRRSAEYVMALLFWHAGFSMFVIGYALLKGCGPRASGSGGVLWVRR